MYYLSTGVCANVAPMDHFYVSISESGDTSFPGDEIFYEFESECQRLYKIFDAKVFNGIDNYNRIIPTIPEWALNAGNNSDSPVSPIALNEFIQENSSSEIIKSMYLTDCEAMIMNIQDRSLTIKNEIGNFYEKLAQNQGNYFNGDSTYCSSGASVLQVFSSLYTIFIHLYVMYDMTTKLAYELENIQTDFSTYPKLKSTGILFGKSNRLKIRKTGTIFEMDDNTKTILAIRNEIIHNGAWEFNNKVFHVTENGCAIEKFILFPDFVNGNLTTYKNRKRFFVNETKINNLLPELVLQEIIKVKNTITNIIEE